MADDYEGLFDELLANPETRHEALGLLKKARPSEAIPEVDVENRILDSVSGQVQAANERSERLENALHVEHLNREEERQWHQLEKEGLVAPKDRDSIKQLIEEGFSTQRTAAQYFASQKKAQEPSVTSYENGPLEQSKLDDFLKNPHHGDQVAHEMVDKMMRTQFAT